ncbi:TPA: hypothetical protein HA242_06635 [Candidatus Woesearchaeota archaeon]|nr:hypothetical protein [Candidatus Woesearchaeota archaeon]HIG92596.1 hypothetical protein [Candidatus Woesearchaeota archaeon]HIH13370.1 hypothetical protein [Candidatus Woesearchaeota archaeon]
MQSSVDYYGTAEEVRELQTLEQRKKELEESIKEKRAGKRYETETKVVYYDYQLHHKKRKPATLSFDEQTERIKKLCGLNRKINLEAKGTIVWNNEPLFQTELGSLPAKPKLQRLLNDIVAHEYHTWNVVGNQFSVQDTGSVAHFYLTWPKGDGNRYDIFDLRWQQEEKLQESIESLAQLSTWAYGSLRTAYRTTTDLIVLKWSMRAD